MNDYHVATAFDSENRAVDECTYMAALTIFDAVANKLNMHAPDAGVRWARGRGDKVWRPFIREDNGEWRRTSGVISVHADDLP